MPAGLGKGIFLKKRSSQVFYPFKAYPLYTIPLPRSGKGARINVVLLNLVIDDPVAYLQIAGGLQHIAMRMLQGVNEQFLFEARHRIVERQRRPAVPRRLEGLGQVSGAQDEIVATLYGELHALGQLSGHCPATGIAKEVPVPVSKCAPLCAPRPRRTP